MDKDLNILYEDNHVIVVLKPQGVPSCGDESGDDSLLEMVRRYLKVTYDKPGNVYVGLVHRLDRPTGGVMVFAKTSKAAARLSAQMKEGDFEKKYLAVLVGTPKESSATVVNYLKKNSLTNTVYVATETTEGAKRSELSYKLLDSVDDVISLVKIKLETGRSHQIRVQFSCRGLPVFGDARYGGNTLMKGANLALWAAELSFLHPVTKDRMVFVSYPPEDNEPWKKFNLEKYLDYGHFNSQID